MARSNEAALVLAIALAFAAPSGAAEAASAPATNAAGRAPLAEQAYQDVSLVALLANPAAYDGKAVRVAGFLSLEFEGSAIYLDREAYATGLYRNAVWVEIPGLKIGDPLRMKDGRYVSISGIFDARDHGHMGAFSGELREAGHIQRVYGRAEHYAELRRGYGRFSVLAWLQATAVAAAIVFVGWLAWGFAQARDR